MVFLSARRDACFSDRSHLPGPLLRFAAVLRRRLLLISALVAIASSVAVLARAAEETFVFEGFDGSGRWIDAVEPADLVSAVPEVGSIGTVEAVAAAACDGGVMESVEFTGTGGTATVTTASLAAALGWSSDDLVLVSHGSQGLPGCWADVEADTATRHVRVQEIVIGGGDGDGFAECAETVELGFTIASITETLVGASVVVEVLGPEAELVGPSWTGLGDLDPRSSAIADDTFEIVVDDTVAGYDWVTVSVSVGDGGGVYRSHRHIPIGCGIDGSSDSSPQIMYPVAGPSTYKQEWLTTHNPYIHEGVDVFGSRMVPIVAVADGVVADVNWEHDPYGEQDRPIECCGLAIRHDSGWESWYLHLNNDTPGTDDGAGWGVMPGLEQGTRVEAGQVIGWMGDSTNAEFTAPHLHFELHDPAGNPVDPYSYLRSSQAASPSCPTSDEICYPFVILSWYSRDPQVVTLQQRLATAGFDPGPADGIFGSRTDTAVRQFQAAADLTIDGLVDEPMWDELKRVVDGGIDLTVEVIAKRGDRGAVVVGIQQALAAAGNDPGPIDGIFGGLTEQAVKVYQSANGLAATGIVDADTHQALTGTVDTGTGGDDSGTDAATSAGSTMASLGSRGELVVEIQTLLSDSGYEPGPIDGIFGSLTDRAVRAFQAARGLLIDGIVGPATLGEMRGSDASRVVVARRGDSGSVVVEIQQALAAAGNDPGPIDGIFGGLTESAVRAFQTARSLIADGVVDQATRDALG
jgi:peptidoglycan hydrolase-like protein with peptidoglycan-binding domain